MTTFSTSRRVTAVSVEPDSAEPACDSADFHVVDRRGVPVLICSGELDIVSGRALDTMLRALEARPVRLAVDLREVGFADTYGLAPLFESARRRLAERCDPIEIIRTSHQVGRVLTLLHVPAPGPVDVHAWDAAAVRAWPVAN